MRNLVPLTKILLTLGTAVWAIIFREPFSLALLCVLELIILLVSNELFKNVKALMMLCVFAFFLGLIEYIGGGTEKECAVAALRMLGMTIIFIYLLATVRLQDLTAAMVQQLKVPYEYAFMFTAGLRFVPDFMEENKAVAEAQSCRGLAIEGNFIKQVKRYMSVVRPFIVCFFWGGGTAVNASFSRTQRNDGAFFGASRVWRFYPNFYGKRFS